MSVVVHGESIQKNRNIISCHLLNYLDYLSTIWVVMQSLERPHG